jgi:hypothetical protein
MRFRTYRWCSLAAALTLAGCGTEASTSSDEIERLEARVQEAERRADEARSAETPSPEVSEEDPSPDCVTVPDVVGKDHQLAQDTMQAAGLYLLLEEDASGQDRMLILDRNWTTVRQRPTAGDCVDEDTEITLYAVKDGER